MTGILVTPPGIIAGVEIVGTAPQPQLVVVFQFVDVAPVHKSVFTEIAWLAVVVPQLFVLEYSIVSVPTVTPDTIPPLVTVATPVLVLLHVPPVAVSLS